MIGGTMAFGLTEHSFLSFPVEYLQNLQSFIAEIQILVGKKDSDFCRYPTRIHRKLCYANRKDFYEKNIRYS